MSALAIDLHWQRGSATLLPGQYSAAHRVSYGSRFDLDVDAAPDWGGDPNHTNPEQALASALSSCHMMTFLALASKAGWPVAGYSDYAVALLGQRLMARDFDRHVADLRVRVAVLNGYTALGIPVTEAVG